MRLPENNGKPDTGASPPSPGASDDGLTRTGERARMFILEAHRAGFDVAILRGLGARLMPFAPDDSLGTPPSVRFYAGTLKQFAEHLANEYCLDLGRLVEGVTFIFRNVNDVGEDIEFAVREPTLEDRVAVATDRLRGRNGLHWSRADANELADLLDVLVMRANRSHYRSAA